MELTTKMVERFIGGQMEIKNSEQLFIYRGEIKEIAIENGRIRVEFEWLARAKGTPPFAKVKDWVKDSNQIFDVSLENYKAEDIGPDKKGDNKLCLKAAKFGETIILYPPNGSKLDPARVEGFQLAQV